jgi:hypothetical protein
MRTQMQSSADSSHQSSPIKSFSVSLPEQPSAVRSAPAAAEVSRHNPQTTSVDANATFGTQSFPVLSNDHRHLKPRSGVARFFSRHWFVIALCVLATLAITGVIAAIMVKRAQPQTNASYYVPADHTAWYTPSLTSYWIIDNGTVVVSREHVVKLSFDTDAACRVWAELQLHLHPHLHPQRRKTTNGALRWGCLLLWTLSLFFTVERPLRIYVSSP